MMKMICGAVDQAFTVKGVGSGKHVQSGKVNKHDELILAGLKKCIARSLQVMDLDVDKYWRQSSK